MAGCRIQVEGGAELSAALRQAAHRAEHLKPAWEECGEVMLRSVFETFQAEGRPQPWKPLADATVLQRLGGARKAFTKKGQYKASAVKKLGRMKILQVSGERGGLLGSVVYTTADSFLEIGSVKVYAAIHQYGGEAGRRSARVQIPARPYLVVQPEDEVVMAQIFERYILEPVVHVG
jgi:phage virion morphogenesis protein